MENQQERMEKHMKQIADTHRQKVALLESQFLQQKQQLLRGKQMWQKSDAYGFKLYDMILWSHLFTTVSDVTK